MIAVLIVAVIAIIAYGARDQIKNRVAQYGKNIQHFCGPRVLGAAAPYVSVRSNFSPDRKGACANAQTGPNAWAANAEYRSLAVVNGY